MGKAFSRSPIACLILTETSRQLSTRKTSHAGPSRSLLSTGLSFATRQLGDRGPSHSQKVDRSYRITVTVHHTCGHVLSVVASAVAYTFSDFFFSYKLEHTSIVVLLTLTEQ